MEKNFMPSRQFIARLIILVVVTLGVFGIYKIVVYFKNKPGDNAPTKLAVKEIVQKDTNTNGIPDWEESLWGLDPTKNGPANKEFILAQRAQLAKTEAGSQALADEGPTTDNELLSKEFFAIIMALQQSGNLNDAAIKGVSDAIGENIVATPIADVYTSNMLKTKGDTTLEILEYYNDYLNLNNKYNNKDIGNELIFIAQGVEDNDAQALYAAETVAQAYKSFGKELMKIAVPAKISSIHLSLANNYEKTGRSIEDMTKVLTDQIKGMKALVNYNKYSDALVADIEKLSDNFN